MRWRRRNIGDIRIKTKFLWWPLEINREVRWLERATIKYVYRESWIPIAFINNEKL
jgi:hypothetical protein